MVLLFCQEKLPSLAALIYIQLFIPGNTLTALTRGVSIYVYMYILDRSKLTTKMNNYRANAQSHAGIALEQQLRTFASRSKCWKQRE